jgi:hypothetical protein
MAVMLQDGGPLIKETYITTGANLLKLYINGKDLNPDSQEPPVVQITGVRTECIASTLQASGTHDTHYTHGQ